MKNSRGLTGPEYSDSEIYRTLDSRNPVLIKRPSCQSTRELVSSRLVLANDRPLALVSNLEILIPLHRQHYVRRILRRMKNSLRCTLQDRRTFGTLTR